ncbi:MAG: DUF4124 domain-containing protein [Gammaproteobacteria bacterium]|nr:DUF4124 domain-containing protein [Gammaproteobacteria bacterium]
MSGIFFRLLFKAMVPVIMLIALMSYMMYLQGQDPLMPLKSVANGLGGQYDEASRSVRRSLTGAGDALSFDVGDEENSTQRIYRWVDADGVTHFGTYRPAADTAYQTVKLDPGRNVMDAYPLPLPDPHKKRLTAQVEASPQVADRSALPMSANPAEINQKLTDVKQLSEARLQALEAIR